MIGYYLNKILYSGLFVIMVVAGYDPQQGFFGLDVPEWFNFLATMILAIAGPFVIFMQKPEPKKWDRETISKEFKKGKF